MRKIKCFDGVEPRITGEIGEKSKDENQMIHRVENDALDLLHGNDYDGSNKEFTQILIIPTNNKDEIAKISSVYTAFDKAC